MEPIHQRRAYFEQHNDELMDILKTGAQRARVVAGETMEEVYNALGTLRQGTL